MIKTYQIEATNQELTTQLQHQINIKTKPLGALGKLEKLALKIGLIQQTIKPKILHPTMLIFAADHGIVAEGVSPYPQEVTWQMVLNFVNGGAAINVFAKQNGWKIDIIDAGVNTRFEQSLPIHHAKINFGTKNFLYEAAMSEIEMKKALETGEEFIKHYQKAGSNCIAFGEMGIGNTSTASVLMSLLTGFSIEDCTGKGTGVSDEKLIQKQNILKKAIENYSGQAELISQLSYFGGFEILQMSGAMLEAFENKMLILVDGFICTVAYLIAFRINPNIKKNAVFCHCSAEKAHIKLLEYLDAKPILNLDLRLGEGTGCAVAFPILKSAEAFLNEMASFESAGISRK